MASKGNNYTINEIVASKIFAMNEKLDSIVQLAHSLVCINPDLLLVVIEFH